MLPKVSLADAIMKYLKYCLYKNEIIYLFHYIFDNTPIANINNILIGSQFSRKPITDILLNRENSICIIRKNIIYVSQNLYDIKQTLLMEYRFVKIYNCVLKDSSFYILYGDCDYTYIVKYISEHGKDTDFCGTSIETKKHIYLCKNTGNVLCQEENGNLYSLNNEIR